jgi:hypothetical protein
MRTSLLALVIALIMAWLVLNQDMAPGPALWLAWAITILITLATLIVLAECFGDPKDIRQSWKRRTVRLRSVWARVWRWRR